MASKYKVSYISAKTGKRNFIRDYKGRIRYYGKTKAQSMAKILAKRNGKIVKV